MYLVVRSWSRDSQTPNLLGRKKVDWSIFQYGTHIPLEFQSLFTLANGGVALSQGSRKDITLVIDAISYKATLVNFDRVDTDIDSLQIRYDTNRALIHMLRDEFRASYEYLQRQRQENHHAFSRVHVRVPDESAEYMEFYETEVPYVYEVHLVRQPMGLPTITLQDTLGKTERTVERAVEALNDEEFAEWLAQADGSAGLELRQAVARVRRYHRGVIWRLKQQYQGKCQLCGWSSLEDYGVDISEAHHIDYFSHSLNNAPSNIVILCPSHHTLVHAIHATFDPVYKAFVAQDSICLPLQANVHL